MSVSTIIVTDQIARRRIPRECLHDLLRQPFRGRVPGHRKPNQLPATMAHDQNGKQALERHGWNHAQINRRDRLGMVAQKRPPGLRRRPSMFDHVFGDRQLGDGEAKLQQFAMDTRGSP